MAQRAINYLKALFITGYKPTQADFADVFDSFVNKTDEPEKSGKIDVSDIPVNVIFDTPFSSGSEYIILRNCYDSYGTVEANISNESITGFTVTASSPATFIYKAVKL